MLHLKDDMDVSSLTSIHMSEIALFTELQMLCTNLKSFVKVFY